VRVLVFGTMYVDTMDKLQLLQHWIRINRVLNPTADLMLVDSASPMQLPPVDGLLVLNTGNNIGHLARGGQDGWGRAFTSGLSHALALEYDYVVHIEGDSLFRWSVEPILRHMQKKGIGCLSTTVQGTKRIERGWAETGLMFFDVNEVASVVRKYDWQNGGPKRYPHCPEWHLYEIAQPHLAPWRAERGDQGQIRVEDVHMYDWITHVPPAVSNAFASSVVSFR